MVSKAKIKFIKSLQVKKYRKQEQSFVVEGAKSVSELLSSDFDVIWLAGSKNFLYLNEKRFQGRNIEVVDASEKELEQLGSFQTNDAAVAVAKIKPNELPNIKDEFCLVLDDLSDPGNVGTIIRTADWYGIKQIIASEETADLYNPKTISATMGSFCRVNVFYTDLGDFFSRNSLPVYGTFMNGEDVHQIDFGKSGLIVIGNESNGISEKVSRLVNHRITIPKIGGAESLNAAIATGIVLDNVFRSKK
ncbi:MAG: RNA methyltransferase [Bacteroidetes bacterium]|nr:RNA methyltransferase [Bacteroidota bacterium]MBI3482890.1 RNA methyltransferase [Bacteroidota bacterium]